jgi:hypothetical protein
MQMRSLAATLALMLAGCAGPGPGEFGPVTVFGTPFLIAFKIPFCVATVGVAGPVSALTELTRPSSPLAAVNPLYDNNVAIRQYVDDGIKENCGPPYIVTR